MKLIFIRHGEPDYSCDALTPKGKREASLLSDRVSKWNVTQFYCSPFGRAKETASYSLQKMNREAITLPWLREFSYQVVDPVTKRTGVPWDFPSSLWTKDQRMFHESDWMSVAYINENPDIMKEYPHVIKEFDTILDEYGYTREGKFYRLKAGKETYITSTVNPDGTIRKNYLENPEQEPTLVFFCHLGIICVILSHLLNIPFPLLTHGFFLPTTSLTILSSEERWGTEAYFRTQCIGDCSHLIQNHERISTAGSFTDPFQG